MQPTPSGPDRLSSTEYYFLREEIRHEDNLVNQRLSWLVGSQSFLLTGFAIALNAPLQSRSLVYEQLTTALVIWLPVAGALLVAMSYLTIWAGILHMKSIRELAGRSHPAHLPPVQGRVLTRRMGLSGPVITPIIFLCLWIAIILQR